jgi:NADH-quinone oxidoreductase subunit H
MIESFLMSLGFYEALIPVVANTIKIFSLVLPLLLSVAYLTYAERKIIGYMQVRIGPNRVGPAGWLQPIADALKLLTKEIIVPSSANKGLFFLGPILTIMPALAAWAVIPFDDGYVIADINIGLLYLMAITSMGVYGVILAGWASNSKYAFLGALRSSAQIISYELPMGFAIVLVLMVTGSLNISDIVRQQMTGIFADYGFNLLSWNWLPLFPVFIVYIIAGVAETNRHPFDVAEGESEIVAGFHVEYSGMAFAVFFLAEYANMILIAAMTSIMFLGGWDAPIHGLAIIPGFIWLLLKICFILFLFIWFRATFPRYRYDQIMRLGWKIFIPVTLIWLLVIAFWMRSSFSIWH